MNRETATSSTMRLPAILLLSIFPPLPLARLVHCDYYNSSALCEGEDTNYAQKNFGTCSFEACGGEDIVISTSREESGSFCLGDTYLRLLDEGGELLGTNNDISEEHFCSELSFSLPMGYECQNFEARIGCYEFKSCEAQTVVNVTGTRPEFVDDSFSNITGDSWSLNCSAFNVSGSLDSQENVFDYDPGRTSVCSFEACPGQYYRIELTDCVNSALTEVFSYGGEDKEDDLIAEVSCGNLVYIDGLGGNSNGKCRLVSLYQSCKEDKANNTFCSGKTIVTAERYPVVDLQWVDALLATPGYPIRYAISSFDVDPDYFEFGSSSLYIATYNNDMLKDQEHCNYVAFDDTTDPGFYDYIDFIKWNGTEMTEFVTTDQGANKYTLNKFGGNYKVVLWLWKKSIKGLHSAYMLASTDKMRVYGPPSVELNIETGSADEYISGTWQIKQAVSKEGDQIVLYELDDEDSCNFHHKVSEYDQALWNQEISTSAATGVFTTSTGASPFRLPDPSNSSCNRLQLYELRYIHDGEVVARSGALPYDSPTSSPTAEAHESSNGNDDYTLEYSILIVAISVAIVAAIIYTVRFQQGELSPEMSARANASKKQKGFEMIAHSNDDDIDGTGGKKTKEVDFDNVDPSLFQIEIGDENDDETAF